MSNTEKNREILRTEADRAFRPHLVVGPDHPVDDWALRDLRQFAAEINKRDKTKGKLGL